MPYPHMVNIRANYSQSRATLSLMIGIGGNNVSSNPVQQSRKPKEDPFLRKTFFAFSQIPCEVRIASTGDDLLSHVGSYVFLPLLHTLPRAALCFSFTHFAQDKSHNVGIEHHQDPEPRYV